MRARNTSRKLKETTFVNMRELRIQSTTPCIRRGRRSWFGSHTTWQHSTTVRHSLPHSLLTHYSFATHYSLTSHPVDESAVSASEVSALYNEVNLFSLAAHFYWGTWGLIRALARSSSFDYLAYAKVRFDEYYRRKDEVLSL